MKNLVIAPSPPDLDEQAEALIEEARQRHRRRRRWIGVFVLLVVLAAVVSFSVTGGSGKPPRARSHHAGGNGSTAVKTITANSPPPAPPSVVVLQAGRLGPTSGWASNVSDLFVTSDAGVTWRTLVLPPLIAHQDLAERISSVIAVGANDLWLAVGNIVGLVPFSQSVDGSDRGAAIFRSTDGGTTWAMSTLPGCLQTCGAGLSLSFVDALHGFASDGPDNLNHTHLFSTNDGGVTWHEVSVVPQVTWSANIVFTTTTDGWALTDATFDTHGSVTYPGYALYRTTDAGHTWTPATDLPRTGQFELPTFFSPDQGVVMEWSPTPTVFSTTDGGTTWSGHPVPAGLPLALPNGPIGFSALDPSTWFVITRVALIETTDGGAHWTKVSTDAASRKASGRELVFFSPTDGWTVGSMPGCPESANCLPTLLATHNGGHTWSAVSP